MVNRKSTEIDEGKKVYLTGTHRVMRPEQTLSALQPLMKPMGITRIANVTGLDNIGIPVVMVVRPKSRSISVSQGKGIELVAAKVSGLMEAIENFHAERIIQPLKIGSYNELSDNHNMINVIVLPLSGERWFGNDEPLLWIEGHNLVDGEHVWLPYESVHTNYVVPQPTGSGYFMANTNGLASGNHFLEAVAHGIWEVVERDAITLWRLAIQNGARRQLDLDSVDDAECQKLLELFSSADIDVKVWDVTSDIGIACFVCLVLGAESDDVEPEFGSGCHSVREIALARALTEAAQARATFISGARDDFDSEIYSAAALSRRRQACRELMRSSGLPSRFDDVPTYQSATLRGDVDWSLEKLKKAGLDQIIVVDLSQERFGIPVVRVVVPGLEGVYRGQDGNYLPGPRGRAALRGGAR